MHSMLDSAGVDSTSSDLPTSVCNTSDCNCIRMLREEQDRVLVAFIEQREERLAHLYTLVKLLQPSTRVTLVLAQTEIVLRP